VQWISIRLLFDQMETTEIYLSLFCLLTVDMHRKLKAKRIRNKTRTGKRKLRTRLV